MRSIFFIFITYVYASFIAHTVCLNVKKKINFKSPSSTNKVHYKKHETRTGQDPTQIIPNLPKCGDVVAYL